MQEAANLSPEEAEELARLAVTSLREAERSRRREFLEQANADWARILKDESTREDIQRLQVELDGTLLDGLEDEPW